MSENLEYEQVQTRSVSLYPADWSTLDAIARDNGLSTSAALRTVIRDWVRMQAREVGIVLEEEPEATS